MALSGEEGRKSHRPLRGHQDHRQGRDGRRLQGARPAARSRRRGEDDHVAAAAGPARALGVPRAVPARGQGRREDVAPGDRHDLRRRRRRGHRARRSWCSSTCRASRSPIASIACACRSRAACRSGSISRRALSFAHRQRIVHRDVKPANVLHAGDNRWKLADFGIARLPDSDLTQVGIFMGTPGYSPPEAIREGRYTPQADVFAWGAVMYELMCGRIPYEGPDTKTTNSYVVQGNAPPPTPSRSFDPRAARAGRDDRAAAERSRRGSRTRPRRSRRCARRGTAA